MIDVMVLECKDRDGVIDEHNIGIYIVIEGFGI
jgi:hypothetical protein